ncbi:hypothetical protein IQ255_13605 [Pleurocapsales cyanobacterium LEGE 10410]|nr:hypothetical protein [Pleurocapsales cyanobacterium LEGE 10410]
MTTIVKHRRTGNEYILLGINGEAGKANPSRFISELFAQEKTEVSCSATVCDVQGNIFLAHIDDLCVTEIDGKKPMDILPQPSQPNYEAVSREDDEQHDFDNDFDEEEFAEEFEGEQDPNTSTESQASFIYGQGSTAQSDVDDDEDWI